VWGVAGLAIELKYGILETENKQNIHILLVLLACLFPKFHLEEDEALESVAEDLFCP
jgi:hypothetical protein